MTTASRARVHIVWGAVAVLAVGVAIACVFAVVRPTQVVAPQPTPATFVVKEGEVGQADTAQASATFAVGQDLTSGLSGTVTQLSVDPRKQIHAGDTIVTINLHPVVVAEGETPAFRDLSLDTKGPDVSQLRAFLGLTAGQVFDRETQRAVKSWQQKLGVSTDGIVHLGDLLFVRQLPGKGSVPADLTVGSTISAGAPLLAMAAERPVVTVSAASNPAFVAGMKTELTLPDGNKVGGVLAGPTTTSDGQSSFTVADESGASACADVCAASLSASTTTILPASIEVVPIATGLVVPDSALTTGPAGDTFVRLANGGTKPVTVTARGQGLNIVTGVEAGTQILLFTSGG